LSIGNPQFSLIFQSFFEDLCAVLHCYEYVAAVLRLLLFRALRDLTFDYRGHCIFRRAGGAGCA
jgi:hypothetical protein